MNPRERILAALLIGLIILGAGGFLGYKLFWQQRQDRLKLLDKLLKEKDEKQARLEQVEADRARLALWRELSLPADPEVARREYEKYLTGLMVRHGFEPGTFSVTPRQLDTKSSPTLANKTPIFTRLTFVVQAHPNMDSLVKMLEDFYRTGLLHEIKTLSILRPLTTTAQSRQGDLDVNMTVEALVVNGADNRAWLLPNVNRRLLDIDLATSLQRGPAGLGMALWAAGPTGPLGPQLLATSGRTYGAIAHKNIFLGRPPNTQDITPEWMAPHFVSLIDITRNDLRTESWLYDRLNGRAVRLRTTVPYETFPFVKDRKAGVVVRGSVARIDDRDLVYRVELNGKDRESHGSTDREAFYRLEKKDVSALLAEKLISPGDEGRVYRVDRGYWASLVADKVIEVPTYDKHSFRILLEREKEAPVEDEEQRNTVELVRGKIVRTEGRDYVVKVDESYHSLHVGQNLDDSLRRPLPGDQVRALKVAAKP
jgi:hypothetical protein